MGLTLFTGIFFVDRVFDVLDKLLNKGITNWTAFRLFAYVMPNLMVLTVPMATLLAALVTFGRMSADGEVVATRATGISLYRLSKPIFLHAILITGVMLFFCSWVLPRANSAYRALTFEIFNTKASVVLQERTFIDTFDRYIFFVGKINRVEDTLQDVIIHSPGKLEEPAQTIRARKGALRKDPKNLSVAMVLQDGMVEWPREKDPSWFHQIDFKTYTVNLDMNAVLRRSRNLHPAHFEMSSPQLMKAAMEREPGNSERNKFLIEFHRRISMPFANIMVILAAIPLGILFRRGGLIAAGVAMVVIFSYYIFFAIGESLGLEGRLTPLLACWLPNIVAGIGGVLLFNSAQKEISIASMFSIQLKKRA